MNAATALFDVGAGLPDRPAVLFDGARITYHDLLRQAVAMAGLLRECGVGQGDRVALFLPNCPHFMVGYYGTLALGGIAVSIGAASSLDEALHVMRDSGAKVVLTTAEQGGRLAGALGEAVRLVLVDDAGPDGLDAPMASAVPLAAPVPVAPEAPAAIVYSSGTTGVPKGVVLSHRNVDFVARSKVRYMGVGAQDRLLLFLPLHHCFGQNAIMHAAVAAGASLVLQRRFAPDAVLAALSEERVTMVFGVPSTFLALYDRLEPEHLASVRYWFCAAAALPRALEDRWLARFGAPIHQGYGLSESSPFASYNHLDGPRPGTVGVPIDEVEMRIVDPESGAPLGAGSVGEIVIRGPNVMLGYWNRPQETAAAIRDGWLHSGDIGRMDADGFFTVEDRVKDMIIVGGENVYPAEVENVVYEHSGVAEVAVYGAAEPYLGEEVRARVVRRPGADIGADAVMEICRRRLAPFKVPSLVEFAAELPKSPTGKVLKRVLRAEAAAAAAARDGTAAELSVADFVSGWLAERLDIEAAALDPERPFVEYGVDSILGVALARDLGASLQLDLDPTLVWQYPSLNTLASAIAERRNQS
ncbi:AMP-binding protein [Acuticoccus sp. I52.16.1]|uniref:AMP-binding protein n=1 Tax=Acuticoccus sp. I52.16.1 TaxID=2928472 RepID=UPI001FD10091|nr:AMP-binding protein [Acuticoccus sp. I52.16.1]UOM34324.1 AMP-binding protein [Acuticoccus sp. I52.16.1]